MDQVQHASGNAGLQRQFAQARGRQWRQLAHLQHGGVAERQAGRDLPGGRHEGHVPRTDQRAHAHRVEQRVVQVRGRRVGVAVDARAHLGKVVKIVRRAWHQLFAGLRDHLAAVHRFGARNLGHMSRYQVAQFADQSGALGCGQAGPLRESLLGGGDGGVDFIATAGCHFSQYLLCSRVDGFEILLAADGLAGDQMLNLHKYGSPKRPAVQSQ